MHDTLKFTPLELAVFSNEQGATHGLINETMRIVMMIVAKAMRERDFELCTEQPNYRQQRCRRITDILTCLTFNVGRLDVRSEKYDPEDPEDLDDIEDELTGMERATAADSFFQIPVEVENLLSVLEYTKVVGLSERMLTRLKDCGYFVNSTISFES